LLEKRDVGRGRLMESVGQDQLLVPVVLGSIRAKRRSESPARLLVERVANAGHATELIDLRDLSLPFYDESDASTNHPSVRSFKQTMARADAVVWLSPEYNHTFTSATKNAIEYVGRELRRKPTLVCGLSKGPTGGVRAVEQLKLVLLDLHVVPIRGSILFDDAGNLFDDEGRLIRTEFVRRIDEVLAELTWFAQVLAWGRSHVTPPDAIRAR
jgi:NAD(P)H-dependent FMN reductase